MSRDIRAIRLRQWAMRAADKINRVNPARAEWLGDTCAYGVEYMGHQCRCGNKPPTWAEVYAHVNATMGREGIK